MRPFRKDSQADLRTQPQAGHIILRFANACSSPMLAPPRTVWKVWLTAHPFCIYASSRARLSAPTICRTFYIPPRFNSTASINERTCDRKLRRRMIGHRLCCVSGTRPANRDLQTALRASPETFLLRIARIPRIIKTDSGRMCRAFGLRSDPRGPSPDSVDPSFLIRAIRVIRGQRVSARPPRIVKAYRSPVPDSRIVPRPGVRATLLDVSIRGAQGGAGSGSTGSQGRKAARSYFRFSRDE